MKKILINKPGKSTLVIAAVPIGAFYEPEKTKGISHFLEHICFKGNPKRTHKQISSSIENVGGILNAFTDWELTAYWAQVGNSYKNLAIDVITDLANKPLIPKKEVTKERDVIVQELKMGKDDYQSYTWDLFNEILYKENSGFHTSIIGTKESLKNINQKELLHYHKKYYNNPTLIIVGDVKNYSNYTNDDELLSIAPSLANKGYKEILEPKKNLTQANIVLGNSLDLIKYTEIEQVFLLQLISAIYRGMSGRLFDVIREQHHLVYRVHFYHTIFRNGSIQWNISLGLDKKNIHKAQKLVIKELSRYATSKELNIAHSKCLGSIEMALDNNQSIGKSIAYRISRGVDWKEFFVTYKKMLKKSKGNVNQFIKEMNFKDHILTGVIPK